MDSGGGSGAGCFEVEIWADASAKFTNVKVAGFIESAEIWSEKVKCSSKIKPRLQAEWVVVREESCIMHDLF